MQTTTNDVHATTTAKVGGALLIAVTLLELGAMAHHPSVSSEDAAQAVEQIVAFASLSRWVHGILIALLLVAAYSLTELCRRRGAARPLVRAGAVAYLAGTLAMMSAAIMSGFVIGGVASVLSHDASYGMQVTRALLVVCGVLNQAFANVGAVAMSAGIVLWSIDLLRGPALARGVGMLGVAVGAVPALALAFGLLRLDVAGMSMVVLLQGAWNIGVGLLLMREAARMPRLGGRGTCAFD